MEGLWSNVVATFQIFFKDQDRQNPDKLIDHIDIHCAEIGSAAVTGLDFYKETAPKIQGDPSTIQRLTVPKEKVARIDGLQLENWKLTWNDKEEVDFSRGDNVAPSGIHLKNIELPKGSSYSKTEGQASMMIANALTDVSVKGIRFEAAYDVNSKAMDKVDYRYGFDDAGGLVEITNRTMDTHGKVSEKSGQLDLEGMEMSEGFYYKESDTSDVFGFNLNQINVPKFLYLDDKIKVKSDTPTVFGNISVVAHANYKLDSENKRDGMTSVMINSFALSEIKTQTIEIYKKGVGDVWDPLIVLTGKEFSGLNNISVKELGYNLETGKPIFTDNTLIKADTVGNTPGLVAEQLSLYFGKTFAADLKTLKVGTISFHKNNDPNASNFTIDLENISLADLAINKLKVVTKGLTISSSGRPAHLRNIVADISIDLDPTGASKNKKIKVHCLEAEKLELFGLKMTKPGKKEGDETIIELKPEEKSTISDISLINFVINMDDKGTSVDYSQTVATTGNIDLAHISTNLGKAFSSESGLEADSLTFKGTGGEGFDLTITKPSVTNVGDKTPMTGAFGEGVTFGAKDGGPVLKGSALVIKKAQDGSMTYALKDPEIKQLKVDLAEKGLRFIIDANMIGGELDVKEGKEKFDSEEVAAWIITGTSDFTITNLELTVDDFAKLKSNANTATTTNASAYGFLDSASGYANIALWGQMFQVPIMSGMIDFRAAMNGALPAAAAYINEHTVLSQGTRTWLDWLGRFVGHMDPWQQQFFIRYWNNPDTALGLTFEAMMRHGSKVSIGPRGRYQLEVTDYENQLIIVGIDLAEGQPTNYSSVGGDWFKMSALLDCLPKHLADHNTRQEVHDATTQAAFLQAQGITLAELERRKALQWENPNAPDDILRNLHDIDVLYSTILGEDVPDAEAIRGFVAPWLGAQVSPLLMSGMNLQFGGSISGMDLPKLVPGSEYKPNGKTGVDVVINDASTPDNLIVDSLGIPPFIWINSAKSFKLDTDGIDLFAPGGLKLDMKNHPNFSGNINGAVLKPRMAIKK